MIINDIDIRREALTTTSSYIVQAPAGSGKTELLTQRYLALLAKAEQGPEEIIAITFTRKAAAEMRARILHSLQLAAQEAPNDHHKITWKLAKQVLHRDAALQWHILENPNRLRILTIDALAGFLSRQLPLLSPSLGVDAISNYPKELYELAAERVLTEKCLSTDKLSTLLQYLDNRVDLLKNLLADLLSHRDQWLPVIMQANTIHQQNALRSLLEKNLKKVVEEKLQLAALATPEWFRELSWLTSYCDWSWEENLSVNQWVSLAHLLLTEKGAWRKTVDKRQGFLPDDPQKKLMLNILSELTEYPDFEKSLADILECPPVTYTDSQWQTLTSLTELLPLLAAQLQLVFQEKKQIDFVELNLNAQTALGTEESPTDLALRLDYQIKHLLIDEFQDTSITHFHFIEKLIAGWQNGDGRTLFMVGDPMQSIYRFRNAEVGLFLRTQQQGIGDITLKPLQLLTNFRSRSSLVDWFNHTFSTLFPQTSDISTGRVTYTESIVVAVAATNIATNELTGLTNSYEAIAFDKEDNDIPPCSDIMLCDDATDEATSLIEQLVVCRSENPHDSIAILVRSRAQTAALIPQLQAHHIPYQAIDIESLFHRAEIQDLLSLTRALHHRADRIAWLALLRAPFCGLKLTDLECIARVNEDNTLWQSIMIYRDIPGLSDDAKTRLSFFQSVMTDAYYKQSHDTFSTWIEKTWHSIGGSALYQSPAASENTRVYFDLLTQTENNADCFSINAFMKRCESLFSNTGSPDASAVQIMTIHKAKGLEFDHVFLPGLQKKTRRDDEKLFRYDDQVSTWCGDDFLLAPIKSAAQTQDPIYHYLKKMDQEKQQHELTRLLYVACTRAKKSLHFFSIGKEKPDNGSFLHLLAPVIPMTASTTLHQALPTLTTPLFSRVITPLIPAISLAAHTALPATITLTLPDQTASIVGTVVHEMLCDISMTPQSFNATRWRARLTFAGILPTALEKALNTVQTVFDNITTDPRGQWILFSHQEAHSEWPLSIQTDDGIEHIIVDRTFVDDNNTRWIIDYKTTQPDDHENLSDFLERQKEKHENQLENYARALSGYESREIKMGLYFPLCCGWLEVVAALEKKGGLVRV